METIEDAQMDIQVDMDTQVEEIVTGFDDDDERDEDCDDLIEGLNNMKGKGKGKEIAKFVSSGSNMESILGNALVKLTEQTTLSINALNTMGIKMSEDILGVKGDIGNMSMKIDSVVGEMDKKLESEMQKMKDELKKLKSVKNDNSLFSSDTGRVLWPKIPLFFDTSSGLYSWFPVKFTDTENEEHDVVVLSVPMTVFLMQRFDGMGNTKFKRDVENHLRTLDRFQLNVQQRTENFTRIMKKTPFKPYSMYTGTTVKRPISFKNNGDNYIIMDAKYWSDLIVSVYEAFPTRPTVLPDCTKPLHKNVMAQQFALKSVSVVDDKTPQLRPFGDVQFGYEDRQCWPAMGFPLWTEVYEPVKAFFDDFFEDGVHQINIVDYDEVMTFEQTLEQIDDSDKYVEEVEEEEIIEETEEETVPLTGNKRARKSDEDWNQDYN